MLEMAKLGSVALPMILVVLLIALSEAATPLFLQAITSALATIPFTGGPMSTGLIGAKLGIGTKLLYYLGYFGRSAVPKTPAKAAPKPVAKKPVPQLPAGLQALPLPYALAGAGGFQQVRGGGGFGGPPSYQMPFGGPDPYQLFQALRAQGYDANTAMQILNYGGFGMNTGSGFPMNAGAGGFAPNSAGLGFPQGGGGFPEGFPSNPSPSSFQGAGGSIVDEQPSTDQQQPVNEGEGSDDIESFFTFLKDMDENGCISRLMCDIGQDPSFLGEFSENINGIVSSLDVQPSSGAYLYIQILENGRNEGGCDKKFLQCPDSAYEVVKSVAPSVGVPQHLNSAAVNDL
ncbi:uncharacterized protein TNIN_10311 [Trichonephila inaurata madagascariensis]|uniref:Uncharacterized protein n=1 Tax=Trichonephila inaurata madagascariensis TaxID=2747483 RepID=A0A8X6WR47_9ARAC|nr:uncharacterized protein TNIN_10311 [Trichonephila inaurata madagascariensis]